MSNYSMKQLTKLSIGLFKTPTSLIQTLVFRFTKLPQGGPRFGLRTGLFTMMLVMTMMNQVGMTKRVKTTVKTTMKAEMAIHRSKSCDCSALLSNNKGNDYNCCL